MTPATAEVFSAEVQGRSPTQIWGRRTMVTSAHPDSTAAALGVLRDGGNAVDAAIALAAAISVTSHNWAGLAGDSAWLLHWAETGDYLHLDGYSTCPRAMTPEGLARQFGLREADGPDDFREEPEGCRGVGVATAMTPGTPGAVFAAWQRFGSLPFDRLLAPAIALAHDGHPVSGYMAGRLRGRRDLLARYQSSRKIFFKDDAQTLQEGDTLRQADLAETLRRYAADPENEFRHGETARVMADYCRRQGAALEAADLAAYEPKWRDTVRGSYRRHDMAVAAPPTAAVHVLQALNILECFDLGDIPYHSPEGLHVLIQAVKLALADRREAGGDPDHAPMDLSGLLDKGYAAARAELIAPDKAALAAGGGASPASSTTHFCVRDEAGNMVSATQTIGKDFGCAEVIDGTGLLMNDRSWWMSLGDGPNQVEPGRRANVGHAPAMVLDGQGPWLAIGSPGGFGIVQYVVQVLVNVLDYGMDIQSAIEAPRFRIEDLGLKVAMEDRFAESTRRTLEGWGHDVVAYPAWTDQVGGVEAVALDRTTGNVLGGFDPRRNSVAAGY